MSEKLTGPYVLWLDYDTEGWQPHNYATLEAALADDNFGRPSIITKIVRYRIEIKEPKAKIGKDAGRAGGGHARAAAMTPEERSAVASKAVKARWGKP